MFEVGKTYKTKGGEDAHIIGEVPSGDPTSAWLIGYVGNAGSSLNRGIHAMKWLKDSGVRGLEGTCTPGLDLVPPSITLDLTFEEAQTLRALLYAHITGPDYGPRGTLCSIGNKLGKAGVSTDNLPKLMNGTRRTLRLERVS